MITDRIETTVQCIYKPEEMAEGFRLIRQLNPDITEQEYLQRLPEMVKAGYFQVVVRDQEKNVIALSGIWINTKLYSGKYLEMDNVVVDMLVRSNGIGSILFEYAEKLAQEHECQCIMLDAYKENIKAHAFYVRKGFVARGFHFIKKLG